MHIQNCIILNNLIYFRKLYKKSQSNIFVEGFVTIQLKKKTKY